MRSGDPPPGNAAATDPPADEPPADQTLAGEPLAWEPLAGELPAGELPADQTLAGEPLAGELPADQTLAGEPLAGEPPADELPADQTLAGEPLAADQPVPGETADGPAAPGGPGGTAGSARWPWTRAWLPWRRPAGAQLRRADRQRKHRGVAGAGFARITVLPAILLAAWLLVGLPLLGAGAFLPAPVLLVAVPLAAVLTVGLDRLPARWPRALPRAGRMQRAAPRRETDWPAWLGLAGTIVVAAGFAYWRFAFNSEDVIVLRDPGVYLQTGYWLAQHGSLPIPDALAAFGGAHPGLAFSSTGFFASGTSVVPGVMSGLPLVLAGAFWVHGTAAAAAMGPILGGLAVLAFGGLVGRLAGPQWAPAGALVLAVTLPQQYTSQGAFSETAAQILLFGGLSLVVDALAPGPARPPGRRLAPRWAPMALGGLALGLTSLVRFDGLLDVLPAIPFIGILVVRRSSTTLPFCIGIGIGVAYGLADAYLLARPFVGSLRPMPELIGLIAAWLAAMTVAVVELLGLRSFRHGLRPALARRPLRWLPDLAAVLVVAALAGLAARPYLQTVRGPATGAAAGFVASLQRAAHLPVDPGRLYAEDTLYWVIWYAGVPAVLLGGFGLALLVRRCLRAAFAWRDPPGAARLWVLPLAVICSGSAAVLWQPHTVPDQPWASRRLVPLVLPGLFLCAIWASTWLLRLARSRGASGAAASVVAACCVVALLVPAGATAFGLGLGHSGNGGALRLTANGMALKRVGAGQVGAVNRLCASLGPSASVVIVDWPLAQQFSQVIRGMCGVPVGRVPQRDTADVLNVLAGIEHAGRRPVLLGSRPSQLRAYGGGTPVRVLDLSTSQDPHTLTQPPTALWPAHYVIWMSPVGRYGTGT